MITPRQCMMARAGLGFSIRDLAARAHVAVNTVSRFENAANKTGRTGENTVRHLQAALERAGAVFLADDGNGEGVRIRSAAPLSAAPL